MGGELKYLLGKDWRSPISLTNWNRSSEGFWYHATDNCWFFDYNSLRLKIWKPKMFIKLLFRS